MFRRPPMQHPFAIPDSFTRSLPLTPLRLELASQHFHDQNFSIKALPICFEERVPFVVSAELADTSNLVSIPSRAEGRNSRADGAADELQPKFPPAHSPVTPAWVVGRRKRVRLRLIEGVKKAQFLADRGPLVDVTSREQFLNDLAEDFRAAFDLLTQSSADDSSDQDLREPSRHIIEWAGAALPLEELFKRWVKARVPKLSVIHAWGYALKAADSHFKGRGAGSITRKEAAAWIASLVANGMDKRYVANTLLRACRVVFAWATADGLLPYSPFAAVTLRVERKPRLRELAFRESETSAILRASLAVEDTSTPEGAAQRWVPWLCAYSGARITEITQLRGIDVFEESGIWTLRLTAEAGTIKTRHTRFVPIHEHLLAQGFLNFVKERGPTALFYGWGSRGIRRRRQGPPRAEKVRMSAISVANKVGLWVRTTGVTDRLIRPNHAWRHTFKTRAERHGISSRTHDEITGHVLRTPGEEYTRPTLSDMDAAMKKFPHYTTDG
jgi:integrase